MALPDRLFPACERKQHEACPEIGPTEDAKEARHERQRQRDRNVLTWLLTGFLYLEPTPDGREAYLDAHPERKR